jgi:Ca-activated chloride channel family protein
MPFKRKTKRQGAILVFVAILLPVVFILMAFIINLSWIDLCRTRSFIAADAATRAAGRTFAITGDPEQAKSKAREIAQINTIAGKGIQLSDSDFTFGQSQRSNSNSRYQFVANASPPNAMRVSIKRLNSSSNGGIGLLFGNTFESGEFEFEKSSVTTRVDVDIALVLDRSGSMIYASDEVATGFPPKANPSWKVGDPAPNKSRWLDLAAGAEAFIGEMEKSALEEFTSLVTYSSDATLDHEPSKSYNQVRGGIKKYTDSFPPGATNIGAGLRLGLDSLGRSSARPSASKVIILMTDGKLNAPSGAPKPLDVAKEASEKGVVIFTITFADEADKKLMQDVAKIGGGQHFHATDGADLSAVLSSIARMLPSVLTE